MKIDPEAGRHPRTWGYAACTWYALFAIVHIYWAAGGDVGLASSAGTDLAARRPDAFVLLARAVLLELILLTGAGGVASSVGPLETHWSLILWNPWFALGGLALIMATRRLQHT